MPAPTPQLLLFTKPPRPGRVKTRLVGDLTARDAARLHEAFLLDLLDRLARAPEASPFAVRIAWALEPGEEIPVAAFPGERQEGEDLGERLYSGLARAAEHGGAVAALGSDHPTLPIARLAEAFDRLGKGAGAGADVVLGPAEDGGYYLIALRAGAVHRRLFEEIAWSSASVLSSTLDRCRELGLRVELLAREADVDTPADLRRLAAELAEDDHGCPRTRALLAALGRLGREIPVEPLRATA